MCETLQNNADWDCFKTPILQEILRFFKCTSGGALRIFWKSYIFPISWMCKKQTSVSHSSTESEIISLDAGLRLDGIPALDSWDLIVAVLGNTNQSNKEWGELLMNKSGVRSPPHTIQKRKHSQGVINDLDNVDFIPSNVISSRQEVLLCVFEDNEAVIKMIFKGRSPTMRHVSRTHRVALEWLFDRVNLDTEIQIKYIDTNNKLADIFTKEISHVTNGIIFCVDFKLAISVLSIVLEWCRKERKNMQVKKESQQSRCRRWIWSRDAAKGILTCLLLLHQKAQGKPDMKVNCLWAHGLSSI